MPMDQSYQAEWNTTGEALKEIILPDIVYQSQACQSSIFIEDFFLLQNRKFRIRENMYCTLSILRFFSGDEARLELELRLPGISS